MSSVQSLKLLNLEEASSQEIFNSVAEFMIHNKIRNCATRAEVAKKFNISFNKASRLLSQFVMEGKLKKDSQVDDLYWLELNL